MHNSFLRAKTVRVAYQVSTLSCSLLQLQRTRVYLLVSQQNKLAKLEVQDLS